MRKIIVFTIITMVSFAGINSFASGFPMLMENLPAIINVNPAPQLPNHIRSIPRNQKNLKNTNRERMKDNNFESGKEGQRFKMNSLNNVQSIIERMELLRIVDIQA